MRDGEHDDVPRRGSGKFIDPLWTADGAPRAVVPLQALRTVWFNTGSLCNIACTDCYMDSHPRNDRLAYLRHDEVVDFLEQIARGGHPVTQIGLTGGEPFMNPDIIAILREALGRGFDVLVLTNAMKSLWNTRADVQALADAYGSKLTLRVSIDHYTREGHEAVRGVSSWAVVMRTVAWLVDAGIDLAVAGRTVRQEDEAAARAGYGALFERLGVPVDGGDPARLVLFPEMDASRDVPEITAACWAIVGTRPEAQMCASGRMVLRRKGDARPVVVPCTLLPYDRRFDLGATLEEAVACPPIPLNHPHCARFCVLGGASCSP